MTEKRELLVQAIGGYATDGTPHIAWPVSFDGGTTYLRPSSSVQLRDDAPQEVLWTGTMTEYEALRDAGYPGLDWPRENAQGGNA